MPDVIQLGPILIKMSLLSMAISVVLAFAAVRLRLRDEQVLQKVILELMSSSLLLAFLVWKFSYVLFYPAKALAQPSSLLYFSGGDRGLWLALIAGVVFVVIRIRKQGIPIPKVVDAYVTGGLVAWGVGHVLSWGTGGMEGWYDPQQALIAAGFVLWMIRKVDRAANVVPWLQLLMWFSISQVYAAFFSPEQKALLAGLSKEQQIFYSISVLALFLANRARDTGGTPDEE
ncbi:hypothetical protein [Brevibacillus choshinensis]|uniref:Diacylglyceryl transferase n=1 Tax=Brevibacillus choshinensis TaxID=54911 RepID=A0ABX7FV14_BRECH|nr:hypothetical protein [Brevibacillus choshinensis]QRG68830.1 hypothetical protein JNE38_06690 [Brevibacillus choshinensis]